MTTKTFRIFFSPFLARAFFYRMLYKVKRIRKLNIHALLFEIYLLRISVCVGIHCSMLTCECSAHKIFILITINNNRTNYRLIYYYNAKHMC